MRRRDATTRAKDPLLFFDCVRMYLCTRCAGTSFTSNRSADKQFVMRVQGIDYYWWYNGGGVADST